MKKCRDLKFRYQVEWHRLGVEEEYVDTTYTTVRATEARRAYKLLIGTGLYSDYISWLELHRQPYYDNDMKRDKILLSNKQPRRGS